MARTTPVPSLALMNIMNLRELIEKCSEEAELEPNSSIVLSDIVVKGNNHHWEQFLFIFGTNYCRYRRYKHVRIDEKYDNDHGKTTSTNTPPSLNPFDVLYTESYFLIFSSKAYKNFILKSLWCNLKALESLVKSIQKLFKID